MKKIFILLIVAGIIGGCYGLYLYNKPAGDVSGMSVDVETDATVLVGEYKRNETEANAKYLNKIILVSGEVQSVENNGEGLNIILQSGDLLSAVNCEMFDPASTVRQGDLVTLKGQCAGYLMDVILTKCVIQK